MCVYMCVYIYCDNPGDEGACHQASTSKKGIVHTKLRFNRFYWRFRRWGKGRRGGRRGSRRGSGILVGFRQGSRHRRASAGFGTRMRVRGRSRARRQAGSADRQGSVHRRARRRSGVRQQAGSADRQGSVHRRARRRSGVRAANRVLLRKGVIHSKVNPLTLSLTVSLQRTISHLQLSSSE